jgi:hypothetical protein
MALKRQLQRLKDLAWLRPAGSAVNGCELGRTPIHPFMEKAPSELLNVATLSPIDGDRYFAGNFVDILVVDFQSRTISVLTPGNAKIQPAGIHYARKACLLFSANYLLNTVSIFKFDGTSLGHVFDIAGLTSPEGVYFDESTGMLAVAEFDGHRVSVWRLETHNAALVWTKELAYAHGVTIMDGCVYATGLLDRQVRTYDLRCGKELAAFGRMGWEPEKLEFLWPTSLAPDGRGNLVVSDAETGWVSIINPATRKLIAKIGGAGPGVGRLSQPYSAVVVEDRIALVSTKDQRFILLDYPSLCGRLSLVRSTERWKHFRNEVPPFRADPGDYSWSAGPRIGLFGRRFLIYSSALMHEGGRRLIVLGQASQAINGRPLYKQLQYVSHDGAGVFFSPYSPDGLTMTKGVREAVYAVDFPANIDREVGEAFNCWAIDDRIVCPTERGYALDTMKALLDEFIMRAETRRLSSGIIPARQLQLSLDELNQTIEAKTGQRLMAKGKLFEIISSEEGRRFMALYSRADCTSDAKPLLNAAQNMLYESNARASLYELSLVSVAVGSACSLRG